MEIDCRDPVTVTFTRHDVFVRLHIPDLPSAVVRGRGNDLLSLVQAHSTNSSGMSLDRGGCREPVGKWLISLGQEGVGASIFWHSCVLCRTLAECALSEELGLVSLHHILVALALVLGFNLFLYLIFVGLNLGLDGMSFLLKLVFLKLEESLLFGQTPNCDECIPELGQEYNRLRYL